MSAAKNHLSGTGNGKAPAEKSKSVQTCNRLSLFLKEKEKGNLRDRDHSFPKFDPPGQSGTSHEITLAQAMTYDLLNNMEYKKVPKVEKSTIVLPHPYQYIILDDEPEDSTNKASSSKPKTAQMTIFYGGKVVVLDDVPKDRARDLMIEASGKIEKPVQLVSTSKVVEKDSDLPIARRASLNKFLANRKERATLRAPYQVMNMSPGVSSSGNKHSFDLNM